MLVVAVGPVLAPVAAAGLLALPGGGDQDPGDQQQVGDLPGVDPGDRVLRVGGVRVGGGAAVQGLQLLGGGGQAGGGAQDSGARVMVRWIAVRASGASSATGSSAPSPKASAGSVRGGRVWAMSAAMRSAKTRPSRREFDASRFAPCTPVQATSPQAYRPGTVVRPRRSVRMPPEA